jgi:DNA-binding CsgD family transcriptional regulator
MDISDCDRIFPGMPATFNAKSIELLSVLEDHENLFLFSIISDNHCTHRLGFISDSITKISGYPVANFYAEDGLAFFYFINDGKFTRPQDLITHGIIHEDNSARLQNDVLVTFDNAMAIAGNTKAKIFYQGVVFQSKACNERTMLFCGQVLSNNMLIRKLLCSEVDAVLHELRLQILEFCSKDKPDAEPSTTSPKVNRREMDVLKLIADGCTSREIAEHLVISFHTAETHRRHLLEKFHCRNTAELIKKASRYYWFQ